jgi:hypothetical protein
MAIDDFWRNLRTAASLYAPSAVTDLPHADPEALERMLRGARLWLTARSVEGFEPDDFAFLDDERREALRESVDRFRSIATHVPGNKPATPEQVEAGGAAFREILHLLQPHRFGDAESFRTQVLLDRELQGKLPRWVTGLFCETGQDVADDPAVWIWVEVTDEATEKRLVVKHGQRIDEEVTSAYRRIGGRRWPFVRFRNPSELVDRQGALS